MDQKISMPHVINTLQNGKISILQQLQGGNNYTFLIRADEGNHNLKAVYKPVKGEQPLWDFLPETLARREVAAFILSEISGWHFVPPTIYRKNDLPLGAGSLQLYIEPDFDHHFFNFSENEIQSLRHVVLFDLIINNADRKAGHVFLDQNQHLWLIDHGLCFHEEDKLRTVIWNFAGEKISEKLITDLNQLQAALKMDQKKLVVKLKRLISPNEFLALQVRIANLIASPYFPYPRKDRRSYPWPLI